MATLAQWLTTLPPDLAASIVIFSPFLACAGCLAAVVRGGRS